ncbi:MAG: hypothetical protein ACON4Q_02095 [Candidatus Puniceispirillaceae bacterium]
MLFSLEALYDPRALAKVKKQGPLRSYAIGHQSISRLWHGLYDDCPVLQQAAGDDTSLILNIFLAWLVDHHGQKDWRLTLWFILWLYSQPHQSALHQRAIIEELTIKAVKRWAVSDISPCLVNLVYLKCQPEISYLVEKQTGFDSQPALHIVSLEKKPAGSIVYFPLEKAKDLETVAGIDLSASAKTFCEA